MPKPNPYEYPITDSRTYLKWDGPRLVIDYEKYAKALEEYIMKIYAIVIGDKNMWYFHSVLFTIESEAHKEAAEIAKRWTMENDDEEYTLHEDGKWKSKDDYIYVQEYELK
jgi:hypothetical protein